MVDTINGTQGISRFYFIFFTRSFSDSFVYIFDRPLLKNRSVRLFQVDFEVLEIALDYLEQTFLTFGSTSRDISLRFYCVLHYDSMSSSEEFESSESGSSPSPICSSSSEFSAWKVGNSFLDVTN